MEYVTDAAGKTITVANAAEAANAYATPTTVAVAPGAAPNVAASSLAPATAGAAITVTGLSTLEQVKDFYEREVARVEADKAAIEKFASSIVTRAKADVVAVETEVATLGAFFKAHYGFLIISYLFAAAIGAVIARLV